MNDGDCCESMRAESLLRIYHYLDGELTTTEIREISIHLEHCPACHDEYEIEAMLKEVVRRSCGREEAPLGLKEKIRRRIAVEQVRWQR
ncbi:mycothiol system anti-sigma-R factor [Brevibacterium casei]|nr:mycothiol system anti-sigma-R factor [Brevibacterium casei]